MFNRKLNENTRGRNEKLNELIETGKNFMKERKLDTSFIPVKFPDSKFIGYYCCPSMEEHLMRQDMILEVYPPISMEHELIFPIENSSTEDESLFINKLWLYQEKLRAEKNLFFISFSAQKKCLLCNEYNVPVDYKTAEFTWPENYIHYIQFHRVTPDPEFKKFILELNSC